MYLKIFYKQPSWGEEERLVKKFSIPWELKYNYMKGMVTTLLKGFLYSIRTKFDAATSLEIYEMACKLDDRVKNMTMTLKDVFKIEGNGIEAISRWFEIWFELIGWEITWYERSKTISRFECPIGCAWMTKPEDLSEWVLIFYNIAAKTINPSAFIERPKGKCAGDSSCEYIIKIKE